MISKITNFFSKKRAPWEQNLIVLWFGTFMAGMAFSEVMPFLSLYVDTLGQFSKQQLTFYSGITYSATYLVTALVSPIWGRLADSKGRKLMILRASLGMAFVLGAMGFVQNVWQLIALRMLQGVFSGYISNSNALLATETPKEKSGLALGTLSTGYVSGNLIGPLLGGALAEFFSYRVTFFITGGLLLIVFFLSYFFVHEHFHPVKRAKPLSTKEVIGKLENPKIVFGMFITTMIIQASNNSITPILSLYVRQLMHNIGPVTLVAGVIAAIPGIATLFSAPRLGEVGDRIGTEKILSIGFIFAICMYIPMAFVHSVWLLGFFRFMVGISDGAMLPAVQAILSKRSPAEVTGRVFSWNQSFQALGNMSGPLIGSAVSGAFDYGSVFISTSILVAINFILVQINTHSDRHARAN
ncbi:Multidrug-efflux transporter, major facilitator superfamily (MFS) [Pediococcus damnosus]|uniref:Multidrug-efflux transporter, major facilitator superfamily (MFS) n=1 Tax=Pediococcus damnosus TaxID=51663 RepID=A0A143A859_9LACO|nr:multidrug efflux MFS transporter [Pediococcus damnosus]AMV60185.1 Multidrug-efflux transporter, major facilitator superfamily (MFS) [Pediococcus damnosus]AMV62705.1 Multidrug-efflux transporter, major facilitator superfamily (MFS) [Pediococcus damnosus]AMV64430.1 Multidrug-efflux transporter, major facilitator superfamily (MFS) [Pediococcus damnosus]AMV67410.1 Multidrug-efflux transporter, major facilitator superfamily (MFS) [Pediococcus damnosus]AMV69708.1 Multidrug-efflux transporter, maj